MSKAERYIELVSDENGHLCDQHALRAVEIAREETLQEVKTKLLYMLNTSVDNKHFFERLDEYIKELENIVGAFGL